MAAPTIKGKYPATLQSHIIIRAIGEKNFTEFLEEYQANSNRIRRTTPPTASQIRLASLSKEIGYTAAAKKVGVDVTAAYYALQRVAKYNYWTGETK